MPSCLSRCGFSLTEVMFAVIVLGIGFILVAAMFPVSISQSRLTVEETASAAIARNAFAGMSELAANGDTPPTGIPTVGQLFPPTDLYQYPPTKNSAAEPYTNIAFSQSPFTIPAHSSVVIPGKVFSMYDPRLHDGGGAGSLAVTYATNLWNAFRRSLIVPADNRFAWVPLYRRDVTYYNNTGTDLPITSTTSLQNAMTTNALIAIQSPFVQAYFLPVAVRNRTVFDNTGSLSIDLSPATLANTNLLPRLVQVDITPNANTASGYLLRFVIVGAGAAPPGTPQPWAAAAEGAFVVISDDRISGPRLLPSGATTTSPNGVNVNLGRMNGRIFRLGVRRADLDSQAAGRRYECWELAPGYEFQRDPGANGRFYRPGDTSPDNLNDHDDIVAIGNASPIANINGTPTNSLTAGSTSRNGANAWIIGRSTNPMNVGSFAGAASPYEGSGQDVGAFVTFVKVN